MTATRRGDSVLVERRDFAAGSAETLFSYQERRPYPAPEDAAEPDQPHVAASLDGERVAFSDGASLRIRDLRSGGTQVVVAGPGERHDDDVAVSPDGKRLAVAWAPDSMGSPTCCAGIMSIDGGDFRALPAATSGRW